MITFLHVFLTAPVYADVVWPALVLEQRLLGVIPITAGLAVEWAALYFGGFGLSWKKAAVVDVVMNAVSTGFGIVLVPAVGLAWELFSAKALPKVFHLDPFNPVTWAASSVIAVLITTAIEAAVVRWGFNVPLGQRRFWILCAANCVSVAIAFASLWIHPPEF